MADNNQLAQMLMFSPQTNAQLLRIQQQQALANALQQQGITPLDTNNRSIGGVGYHISPLEGAAKIAEALVGSYGQAKAADKMAELGSQLQSGQAGSNSDDPVVQAMPGSTRATYNRLMLPESMGGSPRAGAELYNTYAAGMKSFNTGTGTAAAENAPVGTLPPGVGQSPTNQQMPPQDGVSSMMPVQGPQALPSVPQGGIPMPSSPAQMPQAPPAPIPPGAQSTLQNAITPESGMMPTPMPNESNQAYKARLEAAKAGATARAQVIPAGQKTEAEDTGKNLADSIKTFNVAAGAFPRAMQRFSQLRQASADASSGGGVSEEEPGSMVGDYARNYARTEIGQVLEPKRATANQIIDQATKQGVLSELGPQLAGLKGNKFLEGIASGASGLNPADPAPTKINAINGLQDQYISNMKSLVQQRRQYGDPTAPTDMDMAKLIAQHADPSISVSAVSPDGKLGRVSPQHLPDLIQAGGQLR